MSECSLVELPTQPTAVVRATVRLEELPAFFGRAYGSVMAALEEQGLAPVGEPFAYYLGMPTESVDVEAGFPIARPIAPSGDVVASELPGGKVATVVHVGPYEALPATYDRLTAWARERSLRLADTMWEVYYSDPRQEPDSGTWRTGVYWPVTGVAAASLPEPVAPT